MDLTREEMMEVMAVFKEESREHLSVFETRLKDLNKNPSDPSAIEVLHRTAHSMKGAARILGLEPIEQVSMRLESGFKLAKDGALPLQTAHLSLVAEAVTGLNHLIEKLANEGTLEGFDVSGILTKLESFK